MSQIFPFILNKKNQVRNYQHKFTKNFCTQLQYMEIVIRLDAKKMSNSSCCSSFKLDSVEKEEKIVIDRANKFNKNFCEAFNIMVPQDRQSYFLELLEMIHLLINQFSLIMQKKIKKQEKCTHYDIKNYQRELKEKFFSKYVYKNLQELMKNIHMHTFVIKTEINSIIADKIVRFDNFTIHLIQKIKKEQTKFIIDIRNYVLLKLTNNQYILQSLYSTIVPTTIKIKLLTMQERDKMIPLMQEIVKIGKIQRLLLNFQIQKIVTETVGVIVQVLKSGILSSSFIRPAASINEFEDQFSSNMYWRNTIKAGQLTKMHLMKKKTLQQTKYQQMKKNLIQILNKLAAKKIEENERINAFLSKKFKIKQKIKTDTVYEALKDRESVLFPLNSYSYKNSLLLKQSLLMEAMLKQVPPPQYQTLKIMGKKTEAKDQFSDNQSFLSNNKKNETRHRNDKSQIINRYDSIMKYQPCLYYQLYPDFKIAPTDILSQYVQLEINQKSWINSVPKITDNLDLSFKKQKFKANYLEMIKANCKIFKHREVEYKFKIFMHQKIDLKFLVEAISDIQSWPKWHPNVNEIKLISKNQSKNSCQYLITCNCLKTKYEYHFTIHLFQIERKYFLVFKSVVDPQKSKKKNSFFNLFKSIKLDNKREVIFFMLKMQNIGNQKNKRLSRIVFDYSIRPKQANQFIQTQALTLILNFYFISTYWKLEENKSRDIEISPNNSNQSPNNRILNTNWLVSPQIYENELYHQ